MTFGSGTGPRDTARSRVMRPLELMTDPIDAVLLDASQNNINTRRYADRLDLVIFMVKFYLGVGLVLLGIWWALQPFWLNLYVLFVFWLFGVSFALNYHVCANVLELSKPLTDEQLAEYQALVQRYPDQPIVPTVLPDQGYLQAHLANARRVLAKVKSPPPAPAGLAEGQTSQSD